MVTLQSSIGNITPGKWVWGKSDKPYRVSAIVNGLLILEGLSRPIEASKVVGVSDSPPHYLQPDYPRCLVKRQGCELSIDHTKLNPDVFPEDDIPDWRPSVTLKPYNELTKWYLDIETTGLDPKKDRIIYIGIKYNHGSYTLITDPDESVILIRFILLLNKNPPYILASYNGIAFDIPFIVEKLEQYNINHSFKKADYLTRIKNAVVNGRAMEFFQWYLNINGKQVNLIDMYPFVVIEDGVRRILETNSLKNAVIGFKLREDRRLELSYEQIQECWNTGNLEPIEIYLKYDLDDTELITQYLLPAIYYQKLFLPKFSVQRLAYTGNGSKWNHIIKNHYNLPDNLLPDPDEKMEYEGAYTTAIPGLFTNVDKFDFESMYPNIMLRYQICSRKDKDRFMLQVLKYALGERMRLKKLAKAGDKIADQMQGALKVMLNSCFAADTLVTTKYGIYPIGELAKMGKVKVLNKNRKWSSVQFKSYGEQKIWELKLKRGSQEKTIRTTGNHRWFAAPYYRQWEGRAKVRRTDWFYDEMTTDQLKPGLILPMVRQKRPKIDQDYWQVVSVTETDDYEEVYCCVEPKTHSFTLYGGILTSNCYGATGTNGINFNDYKAASLVTAYGRNLIHRLVTAVENSNGTIVSLDTDGIMVRIPESLDRDQLFQVAQSAIPLKIDHELKGLKFFYSPVNAKILKARGERLGMTKNYIYMKSDGIIRKAGKFRNRSFCTLQHEFPVEYLKLYVESFESAEIYFNEVCQQIKMRQFPVEKLTFTKVVSVTSKELLKIGKRGEKVEFYYCFGGIGGGSLSSITTGKPSKSIKGSKVFKDICRYDGSLNKPYLAAPYIDILEEIRYEILQTIGGNFPAANGQLSLI